MSHHRNLGFPVLAVAPLSLTSLPGLARIPVVVREPTTLSIVGAAITGEKPRTAASQSAELRAPNRA